MMVEIVTYTRYCTITEDGQKARARKGLIIEEVCAVWMSAFKGREISCAANKVDAV